MDQLREWYGTYEADVERVRQFVGRLEGFRFSQDKAANPDEAKTLIEEVLAENPKDAQALQLKGRLAMQDKDYTEAIAAFRSVLKDQPDSAEVLTFLAAAHQANGETELATVEVVDPIGMTVEELRPPSTARTEHTATPLPDRRLLGCLVRLNITRRQAPLVPSRFHAALDQGIRNAGADEATADDDEEDDGELDFEAGVARHRIFECRSVQAARWASLR